MEQLFRFVHEHFGTLFIVCIVWVSISFAWLFFKHRKHGISFPTLEAEQIRFDETRVSGFSDKSLFSRLGGARHCLLVTVTGGEVWIRSFFPFNLLKASDLEHRISRSSITSARIAESFVGRRVILDFRLSNGNLRRLFLVLRNPEGFLAALKTPPPIP